MIFLTSLSAITPSFGDLDSDGDGLSDTAEIDVGTSPSNADTDNDDLDDYQEVILTGTDPTNADSDGDGMSDGNELTLGFDPLDSKSSFTKIEYDTAFDWTMPERFGLDENGDGLIDYFTDFDSINPSGWKVNFDACSLLDKDPTITAFEWLIGEQNFETNSCDDFFYVFPYEGVFGVTLTTTNSNSSESYTENVIVQDFLIISFGDSYASGEGSPDISVNGALVAKRIIDLKFQIADAKSEIAQIKTSIDNLQNQKNGLEDDLQVFLDQLSDADKIDIAKCLALQEIIESTPGKITYYQSLIDAEKNKPWYKRNYVKIATWEVQKASLEKILIEATESFDSLNCLAKLDQFNELSSQIITIRNDILQIKENIENLIIQKDNLVDDITQIILSIESLLDLYDQSSPQWQDESSHRSAKSGHAKAALWLEKADPRTSVTFVHQAVSGSKTIDIKDQINAANNLIGQREVDGVILSIGGNDASFANIIVKCVSFEPCFEPDADEELLADICTYAELLQIDLDFDGVTLPDEIKQKIEDKIESQINGLIDDLNALCIKTFKDIPEDETAEDIFFKDIYGLVKPICNQGILNPETDKCEEDFVSKGDPICQFGSYNPDTNQCEEFSEPIMCNSFGPGCDELLTRYEINVKDKLATLSGLIPNGVDSPRLERVYHVEYGDATKDENGQYCDPETNPLSPPFLSKSEHMWIDTVMETQLNKEIQRASEEFGWNYVTGIFNESEKHGLCSTDSWIVGLEETFFVQMDANGIAHPNSNGYAHYGYAIFDDLFSDLYGEGVPRIPDYDKEPPQLTVPNSIVVAAKHPTGSEVTFEVTATDDFDKDLEISCSPLSGSLFALGDTLVNCVAVDDTGKSDSDSFNVKVVLDSNTISAVIDDVESMELSEGTENSLVKKLMVSSESFYNGNLKAAENQLESLEHELRAQNNKKISDSDADHLSQLIRILIQEIEKLK